MKHQKTATKYEGYWAHRTNVSEAIEFLDNALQEAFAKQIDNNVMQEVYSLTKAIKLLQEVENQIDIIRHMKREQKDV